MIPSLKSVKVTNYLLTVDPVRFTIDFISYWGAA